MLSSRSQQPRDARVDDGQQLRRAREEAEALFRQTRQVIEPSVAEASPPPPDAAVRKPRVLATTASPAPLLHAERAPPVSLKQQVTDQIPPSQFPRVRAWVTHGMTVRQVAEVCGVAVGEVERVLRKT